MSLIKLIVALCPGDPMTRFRVGVAYAMASSFFAFASKADDFMAARNDCCNFVRMDNLCLRSH